MTKLCKDCVHFRRTISWLISPLRNEFAKCAARLYRSDKVVKLIAGFGEPTSRMYYCQTMRDSYGDCKPEAILWIPKNAKRS